MSRSSPLNPKPRYEYHYQRPMPLKPDGIHVDFEKFCRDAGYQDNRVYNHIAVNPMGVKIHSIHAAVKNTPR